MSRTYGDIELRGDVWFVRCEPHVAIRFKRVFGKAARSEKGAFRISATPENTYELDWFCQRYPMVVQDRKSWNAAIRQFTEKRTAVERILAADYTPPLFDGLALPPREYQRVAADLALTSGGLLLADDLGIGKTVSAIAMLTDRRTLPALVVTLTHLPRQWRAELARFAPHLHVHVLTKGRPYDLQRGHRGKREPFPDVIIANYHKLGGWAETLAGRVRAVIFDEVQELRHSGTTKYEAAEQIAHAGGFRMGLSATPIHNYGGEIYNVLNCIAPGALGTKTEFHAEWCEVVVQGSRTKAIIKKPEAMGVYLRDQGLLLRRTRADVGRELPPLVKVPHYVGSDMSALDSLSASVAELCRIVLSEDADNAARMRAGGELDWRLRQATGLAKAPFVADFVRLLVESGESVVLYGWHHAVYDVWRDRLKDLNPVSFTGAESVPQKEAAKQAFLSGESKVLIMSLRSGAGLDGLQRRGRTVVFGELDWSFAVHEQCTGRIHRDEQGAQVVAYYLMSEEGSDPVIADVLGLKEAQLVGVRDGTAPLFGAAYQGDHVRRLAEGWMARSGRTAESELPGLLRSA